MPLSKAALAGIEARKRIVKGRDAVRGAEVPKTGVSRHVLTLPFPPSTNKMYIHTARGVHLSSAAILYKGTASKECMVQRVTSPIIGEVRITIHLYKPLERKGQKSDTDNRLKVMLDSLQGNAYENDEQIAEIHIFRHTDAASPRVEIVIEKIIDENSNRTGAGE